MALCAMQRMYRVTLRVNHALSVTPWMLPQALMGSQRLSSSLRHTYPRTMLSVEIKQLFTDSVTEVGAPMWHHPLKTISSSCHKSGENSEDLMKHLEAENLSKKQRKLNIQGRLSPSDTIINVGKLVPHRVLDLIDDNGDTLKAISSSKASALAQEKELKLVLVNQHAKQYPLYKLMTGHELHEEQVKLNKKRKTQTGPTVVKDIKLSAAIGSNDIGVKRKHLADWLSKEKNIQIRLTVMQKRGQNLSKEEMIDIVHKLIDGLDVPLVFNNEPKMSGKNAQNLAVVVRPMSAKEKARHNKEKNFMEHMKNIGASNDVKSEAPPDK